MPETSSHSIPASLLEEENKRLRRAVEELSILNDLSRAIGASLNSEEIIQTIIRRSLRAVNAEQGVITLIDDQNQDTMKTLVRTTVSSGDHQPYHFSQSLLGWMQLNKKPLLIQSPAQDERFRGITWESSIRSVLCVPLMVKSNLIGVLTVYNRKDSDSFSENDQRLLAIIAAQSAQVVENARLYEKEKDLVRMQEELRLAARIQQELLPKKPPTVPGYDIYGTTRPAQVIGGDYFDFVHIDDGHIGICIGDVSGKGLPASLLVSNLQATVRSHAMQNLPPKELVRKGNKVLFQNTSPEKFATFFYAVLDTKEHVLHVSNGGHDHPFLFNKQGEHRRLKTGGIPLGMFEDFPYEEEEIPLEPGDLLVMYSDGITESMNALEEEFGETRLLNTLQKYRDASSTELIANITQATRAHAGDTPQMDDMTLVVLRRKA